MILNYLKIAWRNLLKNKVYSFINIGGLAVGITVFSLISLYVYDELSFENHHKKADDIVRLVHHAEWTEGEAHHAVTSAAFAPALKTEFPEIKEAVRIVPEGGGVITFENKTIKAGNIFFADKNAFDVFTFPFIAGNPKTALSEPNTIVITESLAKKIFGTAQQALNQTIDFDKTVLNKVTGVIEDIPGNSHLQFEGLRSLPEGFTGGWQDSNLYTYLLLDNGVDKNRLEAKLPQFAQKTILKEMPVVSYKMELQPLRDIHLHSNLQYEISANNSINRVYLFMALAGLILVIAMINYMNLATARAGMRIREVGVRKAVGSTQGSLIGLFMVEAVTFSIIASFIASLLISLLLPFFNQLADKSLTLSSIGFFKSVSVLALFSLVIGFMSGSYPALFLSRFKTILALKGLTGSLNQSIIFRKSLVVFQFAATIILIAGAWIIYEQLQFSEKKDLGFNREQVVTVHIDDRSLRSKIASLKDQLMKSPLIEDVAAAGNPIGNNNLGQSSYNFEKADGSMATNGKIVQELTVNPSFVPTMDIKMKLGSNFSENKPTEVTDAALINETLMKELGFSNPLGKRIQVKINNEGVVAERQIIGVFKDFHTYSLQHKVEPMVMVMREEAMQYDNLYIKINSAKAKEALVHIEKTFREFDKLSPIDINFLNQNFARQYESEQKQGVLSLTFAIVSVLLACLGLFGLAAFTAQQRVKEIGIRKILGASLGSIFFLLNKDFIKLVLISSVIAIPSAVFLMNSWLQNFAYKIDIQWWVFAGSGFISLLIALLTVSYQAIKAALMNPVRSLKSE
ncbi:ABC transporter permease [Emticicia sp. CRIBPO]|uniref:ABC transporter permease n=1 Tax=Emticicia sp. CRIBPO TaxID=2683258 RepID=UPI0014121E56|nr:ABC transporter permease [Emticicia sp. CRIBPO]NBA85434.1 ABC transporter permease [Emticicia sp. CRIBPO]